MDNTNFAGSRENRTRDRPIPTHAIPQYMNRIKYSLQFITRTPVVATIVIVASLLASVDSCRNFIGGIL